MDLSQVKSKLSGLNNKKSEKKKYEKIDYSKIYWKPKAGTHQMRIVPLSSNKAFPFIEVFFHYGFGQFPIPALTNWGEQDPIVDFSKKLQSNGDTEDWKLGNKMKPKARYYAPVLVRGEEELGVRMWEFGSKIYKDFLNLAADEDYGDFTDVNNGFDFTVEVVKAEMNGREVNKVDSIRIKRKESTLTQDAAKLEKWLTEQPDVLSVIRHYKFDELKAILTKWLDPEAEEKTDDEEEDDDVVPAVDEAKEADDFIKEMNEPVVPTPVKKKSGKKADEWNDLFNKEENK